MTDEEYFHLKERLESDSLHTNKMMLNFKEKILSSIGGYVVSFILWIIEMTLKASGILIWPLLAYLKAKGYINIDITELRKWIG